MGETELREVLRDVAAEPERASKEGYVDFRVAIRVRTAEFSTWRPERISAFFGGIAQVLAAKGRMDS